MSDRPLRRGAADVDAAAAVNTATAAMLRDAGTVAPQHRRSCDTRGDRLRRVGLAGAVVVAGAGLSLLRQGGAGALDTLWAEDGAVFLADAVTRPLPEALTTSYAGYFHTGPRLLAELVVAAPPRWAAVLTAVAAAVVTAALALLVYTAAAAHLRWRPARVAAAALVVAPPLALDDLPNSLANLHWPALYALFWVLLWTPAGRSGRVVALVTTALVTASDILVVALLPLALLRARRGGRYRVLLAGVLAAGIAAQVAGLLTGASARETVSDPVRAAVGYPLRVVPAALLGERWLGPEPASLRWLALAVVAWVVVAAAMLVAVRGRTGPRWRLAAVAAVHSFGLWALPVFLSGVATPRYAAAPALLLVVALLAVLTPVAGRPVSARPALALLTLVAVVCAVNLRPPNARADGPSWSAELAAARAACAAPDAPGTATLVIPPRDGGWTVTLPCSYLTG